MNPSKLIAPARGNQSQGKVRRVGIRPSGKRSDDVVCEILRAAYRAHDCDKFTRIAIKHCLR